MKLPILIISCLALSACGTAHYKAIARNADNPKKNLMIGEIVHNLSTGGGTIKMYEYNKDTVCEGTAESKGIYDGTLELTCTDGRTATGVWEATTLKSGFGSATDSNGVRYDLVFGLSDNEVQNYIDEFVR